MGTSDHSPVPNGKDRNPLLLTPFSAPRCPLSLVPTVSAALMYQAAVDSLCLSIPSLPLVQDILRLAPSAAPPVDLHAESSCTLAPHPDTPLSAMGVELVPESVWGTLALGPSFSSAVLDATDAPMVAFTTFDALGCSDNAVCVRIDTACQHAQYQWYCLHLGQRFLPCSGQ